MSKDSCNKGVQSQDSKAAHEKIPVLKIGGISEHDAEVPKGKHVVKIEDEGPKSKENYKSNWRPAKKYKAH